MKPLVETSQTVTSMLYQLWARSWVRPATGVRPDLRGLNWFIALGFPDAMADPKAVNVKGR
jgi:hypothetical protein